MTNVFKIALLLFSLWILFSTIILTYGVLTNKFDKWNYGKDTDIRKPKIIGVIMLSGCVGYFALIYICLYQILYFIPETWSYMNEEGDWISSRIHASTLTSLGVAFIFFNYWRVLVIHIKTLFLPQNLKRQIAEIRRASRVFEKKPIRVIRRRIEESLINSNSFEKKFVAQNIREWAYEEILRQSTYLLKDTRSHECNSLRLDKESLNEITKIAKGVINSMNTSSNINYELEDVFSCDIQKIEDSKYKYHIENSIKCGFKNVLYFKNDKGVSCKSYKMSSLNISKYAITIFDSDKKLVKKISIVIADKVREEDCEITTYNGVFGENYVVKINFKSNNAYGLLNGELISHDKIGNKKFIIQIMLNYKTSKEFAKQLHLS